MTTLNRTAADSLAAVTDSAAVHVTHGRHLPSLELSLRPGRPHMVTTPRSDAPAHIEAEFKVFDFLTGQYGGQINVDRAVWQETYCAQQGQFTGSVALNNTTNVGALSIGQLLIGEVNGLPRFAGMIQKVTYSSADEAFSIMAVDVWTAFFDRYILTADLTFASQDEIHNPTTNDGMLFGLLNWVLADSSPPFGLTADLQYAGTNRDLTVVGLDFKALGDILRTKLIGLIGGGQIRIDCVYDDPTETPHLILRAASPTLGRRFDITQPQLTPNFRALDGVGGEVISYIIAEDVTTMATHVVGVSNTGGTTLYATATNAALEGSDFARRTFVLPTMTGLSQSDLQARVNAELQRRGSFLGISAMTVTLASVVGYRLLVGDDIQFTVKDGFITSKSTFIFRCTGITVNVDDETAELILDTTAGQLLVDESTISPTTAALITLDNSSPYPPPSPFNNNFVPPSPFSSPDLPNSDSALASLGGGGSGAGGVVFVAQIQSDLVSHTGPESVLNAEIDIPVGCTPDVTLVAFGSIECTGDVTLHIALGTIVGDPTPLSFEKVLVNGSGKTPFALTLALTGVPSGTWFVDLSVQDTSASWSCHFPVVEIFSS